MAEMEKNLLVETLATSFLFENASVIQIDAATPFLDDCCAVTFAPREIIQNARSPINGLAILCEGEAIVLSDSSDKAVPLRTVPIGGVFGAASLYSSESRYETVVRAITECTLLVIPTDTVKRLIGGHPVLAENYIRFLSDRICFLNRKITAFTVDSAEGKLAVYLSELPCDARGDATLPVSFSELADSLGMGRASLYRALTKFEEAGILQRRGKKLRILDSSALLSVFRKTE